MSTPTKSNPWNPADAALFAGLLGLAWVWPPPHPELFAIVAAILAIGCGLVAWRRAPKNVVPLVAALLSAVAILMNVSLRLFA